METKDIACVKYLPACYCNHDGMGLDLTTGEYVRTEPRPVFVRVGGELREAKRWLWLWRIVAWAQGVS